MTNYSSWSVDKLNKELEKIQRVIKTKEARDKKATLAKLVLVARKSGFELHELMDSAAVTKAASGTVRVPSRKTGKAGKRGKVAPKYKNPANESETWTGRGRQPIWVRDYVQSGGSLDQVTIVR
ncbi:H-NS histone family protein [Granulosicoccus sp.]|nr:H-NS histone family protein [Granulosicoccus sp.]MDB4222407.1 H-NS histone family protein [Granulosicoccus sp.]